MNIIASIWRGIQSIAGSICSRKGTILGLLGGLLALYWVYYSYNRYEFTVFVSYFALLVAAIAALAALLSLKYTRDTVRPFLTFKGTINIGRTTLAFPITNTGSMPADDIMIRIDAFELNEEISLENVSKRYANLFEELSEDSGEALILFPNQTWQHVLSVDLTGESGKEVWEKLLNGNIRLRITISYRSFRRKHKTIQTLAFDELSLSKDGKYFHGLSVKPQKWV